MSITKLKARAKREEQKLVRILLKQGIVAVRIPTSGTAGSHKDDDDDMMSVGLPDILGFKKGFVHGIELKTTEKDAYRFSFAKNDSLLRFITYTTMESIPVKSWVCVRFMHQRKHAKKFSFLPLLPSLMKGTKVTIGKFSGYTLTEFVDYVWDAYQGEPKFV